jgi:hypothetical protein
MKQLLIFFYAQRLRFVGSPGQEKGVTQCFSGRKPCPPELTSDEDDTFVKAQNLFDIDDVNVEMSSYAPSLPPTSDIDYTSSGYNVASDFNDNDLPPVSRKRAHGISGSDESSGDKLVQKPVKKSSRKGKVCLHLIEFLLYSLSLRFPVSAPSACFFS